VPHLTSAKKIVAIGEALWDIFPDERRPGGAPCNVAFHAARLGDQGAIITRVGCDELGSELIEFLGECGVVTDCVQRDGAKPTGTVLVTVESPEPQYEIVEDVAWDYITADELARGLAGDADAICVGSLAQRTEGGRKGIHSLLSEARGHAQIVFDVNLRSPFIDVDAIATTLQVSNVVKLNETEVAQLSDLLRRPSLISWLIDQVGVDAVFVTRGADGASVSTVDGTVSAPGMATDTSGGDPVGAGDAFTAMMMHQLVRQATPEHTLHAANRYAALVATKQGAMPEISAEELDRLKGAIA
jgi:fructokinase